MELAKRVAELQREINRLKTGQYINTNSFKFYNYKMSVGLDAGEIFRSLKFNLLFERAPLFVEVTIDNVRVNGQDMPVYDFCYNLGGTAVVYSCCPSGGVRGSIETSVHTDIWYVDMAFGYPQACVFDVSIHATGSFVISNFTDSENA